MSAAPNRFKPVKPCMPQRYGTQRFLLPSMLALASMEPRLAAPSGLSPAAPDLPAQIGKGRRAAASGGGTSGTVHVVTSVGVL